MAKNSGTSSKKEVELELENEDILMELECPVCHEYMYPPIKQCTTGHSLCELCFDKASTCPTCRSSKGSTRNFALEGIHAKVQVPCKYKISGCPVLKIGPDIRAHQEFCEFGERPCPLKASTNCAWTGKPKDLLDHAKENHDQHLPIVNNCAGRIKNFLQKTGEGKYFQLVDAYDKIFKYGVNLTFKTNIMQWSVQFVGPREEVANYSYLIKFIDKNKEKEQYAIISTCQEVVNDDQAFASTTSSSVYYDKLKQFCGDDGDLHFHFKIFKTKEFATSI